MFRSHPVKPLLCLLVALCGTLSTPAAAQPGGTSSLNTNLYQDVDQSGTVTCGDIINYVFGVNANLGETLEDTLVVIPVPAEGTLRSGSILAANPNDTVQILSGNSPRDREVRVLFGTVCREAPCFPVGASMSFQVTIQDPNAGRQLETQATISGSNFAPFLSDDSGRLGNFNPTVTPYEPCLAPSLPDTSITKSDGGVAVTAGGLIRYTLTYQNPSLQSVPFPSIVEIVPAHTTFQPNDSTPGWLCTPNNFAGAVCTFDLGLSLDPGDSGTVDFTVRVSTALPQGVDLITNTATLRPDDPASDANPDNNTDTETTPVAARPDLTLTKSDGGATTEPGGSVTYQLTYRNVGSQAATGVQLTEALPNATTPDLTRSTPGWNCTSDTCLLNLPTLPAGGSGSVQIVLDIDDIAPNLTLIENRAAITDDGSNGADPSPNNNIGIDTTPVNQPAPPAPDLTLTKSDGGASVSPGGTVIYTLDYTNASTTQAFAVEILDTIPPGATFTSAGSTPGWNCILGQCVFGLGTVAGGETGMVRIAFTVEVPTLRNQLTNTAVIEDDGRGGADPTPANNTATDTTPILPGQVDLALTKDDGGVTVQPGDLITYTLTVENWGTATATEIILTDTLPANTDLAPGTQADGWNCGATECSFRIETLDPGESATVAYFVRVRDALTGGAAGTTQITNTARVMDDGTSGADTNPADNTATETTPLTGAVVDLQLSKDDGGATVEPGQVVVYTFAVANVGAVEARQVILRDTLPPFTAIVPQQSDLGWNCTATECVLSLADLPGNGAVAGIRLALRLDTTLDPGINLITNTATVNDDGTDTNLGNNTDTEQTPITGAVVDLQLNKDDSGATVEPGQVVVYSFAIANVGAVEARQVILRDTLPPFTSVVPQQSDPGWNCTATECVLSLADLPGSGAVAGIQLALRLDAAVSPGIDQLTNTAVVTDDGADTNLGNNTATEETPITNANVDLSVTKDDGGATVQPGQTVTYSLTYRNQGPATATDAALTDFLPAETTPLLDQSTPGWSCPNRICTFLLGDLPAGATGEVTLTVRLTDNLPADLTILENTASVTGTGTDTNPANNTATEQTPIVGIRVDLTLTKDDGGVTVAPGGTVTYRLTFQNRGNTEATGVVLRDRMPTATQPNYDASTPGWLCELATCSYIIGNLPAGAQLSVDLAFDVNRLAVDTLENVADITLDQPDANPADNRATDTTPIVPSTAAVWVTKDDDLVVDQDGDGLADPGDQVSYTVDIVGLGPDVAEGIVYQVQMKEWLTLLRESVVLSAGTWEEIGGVLRIRVPEIAPEEAVQLTYTVVVGEPPVGVTEIVCQGLVCATNTPKVPSDDPDLPGPEDPTVTPLDPPMGIVEVPVLGVVGLVLLTVVLAGLGCWVILGRGVGTEVMS